MTQRITDRVSVVEFREVACEYCALLERRSKVSAVGLLQEVYLLLPKLALAGAMLPTIDRSEFLKNDAHEKYRQRVYLSLGKKLDDYNWYREVFDPQGVDKDEPVHGHLSDDLSDIYCGLKGGLDAWDKADASTRRDIVFTWRLNYEIHWGEHVTGAFRAIHSLLYDHIDGEDEFPIGLRYNKKIGEF